MKKKVRPLQNPKDRYSLAKRSVASEAAEEIKQANRQSKSASSVGRRAGNVVNTDGPQPYEKPVKQMIPEAMKKVASKVGSKAGAAPKPKVTMELKQITTRIPDQQLKVKTRKISEKKMGGSVGKSKRK